MKPIYLKMTAFGSYLEPAEIDFTRLYDSGIFLITGQTGGGKTTILDAICAALYGKATGNERAREWRPMRCSNAPASVDTEIEYIFSQGSTRYKFYRRWHVPRSRDGEARLDDTENACFRLRDGNWELVASGSSRSVNSAAEEILRLTQEQFVKVIMLPQGEFRELLIASSDDKTRIFKHLFDTERWESITDRITQKYNEARERCAAHTTRINGVLQAAGCESDEQLQQRVMICREELAQFQTRQSKANEATEAAAAELHAAEEIHGLFEERDRLQAEGRRLEEQNAQCEAWQTALTRSRLLRGVLSEYRMMQAAGAAVLRHTQACREAGEALKQAAASRKDAIRQAEELPELEEEKSRLLRDIARWDDLLSLRSEYEAAAARLHGDEKALEESRRQLAAQEQKKNDTETRLQTGNEFLKSCHDAAAALLTASERLHEQEQRYRTAKTLEENATQEAELEKEISGFSRRIEEKASGLEALQKTVAAAEQAIAHSRAYALAMTLSDGAPCPVCGAMHHPSPAARPESVPTAQELETCRNHIDELTVTLESLRQERTARTSRLGLLRNASQRLTEESGGMEPGTSEDMQTEIAKLRAEETRLKKQAGQTKKAENRLRELEQALKANDLDRKAAETALHSLENRMSADRQTVKSLSERLSAQEVTDFSLLAQRRAAADRARLQAENAIRSRSEALSAAEAAYSRAEATYRAAEEALETARQEEASRTAAFRSGCAERQIAEDTDIPAGILKDETESAYEASIREHQNRLAYLRTRGEQLKQALEGKARPALEALRSAYAAAAQEGQALSQQIGQAEAQLARLSDAVGVVRAETDALNALRQEFDTAARLRGLLSGSNDMRTSIHEYVIGIKMDEVLYDANLYLQRLSAGQYAMRRKDPESVGGRAKRQGLDIEILDSSAGKTRPVSTLSGGEMFLASLSLAFGLSDVVQSFSGGVRLDSLFIDEGFGSLDSGTLDAAMDAITQVRENKLLGIISHVTELKERIPCGIEVIKTPQGSHLRLHTSFGSD